MFWVQRKKLTYHEVLTVTQQGASSRYSCREKRCSQAFYVITLWIVTQYVLLLLHSGSWLLTPHLIHAACHHLHLIALVTCSCTLAQTTCLNRESYFPSTVSKTGAAETHCSVSVFLFVLQARQGASRWAGSCHFLDYWLLGGGGPGKLFLLCGKW